MRFTIFIFFLLLSLTSCFGNPVEIRGTVYGHEKGIVKTVGGRFAIGKLPSPWKERRIRERAVLFENPNDHSTITVSAWCKGAVDDVSQDVLSHSLIRALKAAKILEKKEIPLGGRQAIMARFTGELDHAPVYLKTYVLKMNQCVFDFYYVATGSASVAEATSTKGARSPLLSEKDFDQMVQGFVYLKGPEVL